MRVHHGQLSLLELDELPKDETSKRPPSAARQAATRPDKHAETAKCDRRGASVSPESEAALLTTEEVAGLLRVNPRTVQRLVARGEFSAVRIGSAVRFDPVDLAALTDRLKDGACGVVRAEDAR